MNTRQEIQDFVAQKCFAVVGMSRNARSFSATAVKELKARGYRSFAVNPNVDEIRGEKCYRSIRDLPEKVGAALFITPPSATESAVREAVELGVTRIWLQQGAESKEAVAFCEEKGLAAVSGHCILMFAEPVGSVHRFHRFVKGLFGGLPR